MTITKLIHYGNGVYRGLNAEGERKSIKGPVKATVGEVEDLDQENKISGAYDLRDIGKTTREYQRIGGVQFA